jgi:hypothetical protein
VNLGTRASIQTYQGLAYAEYLAPGYYVRGSARYGGLDYQQTRQIDFDGFRFGSLKSGIFTVRAESGVPLEYHGSLLIPYAALTYNHLKQDGYTENAGNGAGLTVQSAFNEPDRTLPCFFSGGPAHEAGLTSSQLSYRRRSRGMLREGRQRSCRAAVRCAALPSW